MTVDAAKLVETLVKAQMASGHATRQPDKPVVTLSRDYGSGGREIAQFLAQRLGVPVYDKELLDAVVERSGIDPNLMAQLDERTQGTTLNSWLVSLLSGENMLTDDYRRHLVKVVLAICNTGDGGVIIGRGAHLILAQQEVFRVRVVASPDTCAARIAEKKGVSREEGRKLVDLVNQGRGKFVHDVFNERLNTPTAYDLVINTDRLSRFEDAAEIIIFAMQYRQRIA